MTRIPISDDPVLQRLDVSKHAYAANRRTSRALDALAKDDYKQAEHDLLQARRYALAAIRNINRLYRKDP